MTRMFGSTWSLGLMRASDAGISMGLGLSSDKSRNWTGDRVKRSDLEWIQTSRAVLTFSQKRFSGSLPWKEKAQHVTNHGAAL